MIKYGIDKVTELRFLRFFPMMERRDSQWIDIVLQFVLSNDTPAPDDLIELTALVICTREGTIAQIVPQDEGTDCEYQFTVGEKEQIANYILQADIQAEIVNLPAPYGGKLW